MPRVIVVPGETVLEIGKGMKVFPVNSSISAPAGTWAARVGYS